jgi:hypothetical protein
MVCGQIHAPSVHSTYALYEWHLISENWYVLFKKKPCSHCMNRLYKYMHISCACYQWLGSEWNLTATTHQYSRGFHGWRNRELKVTNKTHSFFPRGFSSLEEHIPERFQLSSEVILLSVEWRQVGRLGEIYCGYISVRSCFVIVARKVCQHRLNAQLLESSDKVCVSAENIPSHKISPITSRRYTSVCKLV